MLIKKGYTWEDKVNYYDANIFKSLLDNLKTYAKALNSASYSVTKTLNDVYENIKYQHALWVSLTELADDTLNFKDLILEQGKIYNFLKHFDQKTLLESSEFRLLIQNGIIKVANSKLYDESLRQNWFSYLNPILNNQYLSKPFDYLIISYKPIDILAQDIDTRTSLVNTNYQNNYYEDNITNGLLYNNISLDNNEIGFGKGSEISSTSGLSYLNWGGDNFTSTSPESVLVSLKNISEDIKYLKDITIRLKSLISGNITDGRIQITLTTFKGGVMTPLNNTFINTGGVKVSETITNRQIYRGRINYTDSMATCNNNGEVGLIGCDLWAGAMNEEGDDVGTIMFNILNSNCIITDELYTDLLPTFTDNLNTINFNKFTWDMGTSGLSPYTYQDMILNENFVEQDLIQDYQHFSDFSQNNVFTSQKVWDKLLNNFYLADLATTSNIVLFDNNKNPISYSLFTIDNTLVVEGHIILFKDQIDLSENGLYTYTNSSFVKQDIFKTEEEVYFFSAFIKQGDLNINKEFFLDTQENGIYSLTIFPFVEGNNYVLRNRCSYRLLADHTITDSDYFTSYEPVIDNDFTYRYFDTNNSYYTVSEDDKKIQYFIDNLLSKENNAMGILLKRIENIGNSLYFIRDNNLVIFNDFTSITNKDVFTNIYTYNFTILDFQIIDINNIYLLTIDKLYFNNEIFNITANEFRVKNNTIFYCNNNGIYIFINNKSYTIIEKESLSNISVEFINNKYVLYYLENLDAKQIEIDEQNLISLVSWNQSTNYSIENFSKTKIGDWELKNNNLYLKDIQITNTNNDIPKILTGNNRYYDSINNYSDINVNSIVNLNSSFTMEFSITPTELKVNQTVLYFGKENTLLNNNVIPPSDYFSFVVNSGDDYPSFIFSINNKKLYLKSSTKLVLNQETNISLVWNYSSTKTYALLYFDGQQVGTLSDILAGNNIPMNLLDINFQKCFLGKTEDLSFPSYKGYLREVRIWNTVLNSAQILSRINKNLTIDNDTLFNELLNYWTLNDEFNIQNNYGSSNIDAIFYGSLNSDIILKQIKNPQEIQLSDSSLYVKDFLDKEEYFYSLNSSDINNFDVSTQSFYQTVDFQGTNMLFLTPNNYLVRKDISNFDIYGLNKHIEEGDIVQVEVYNYYSDNDGTGGYLSLGYGVSVPDETSFLNSYNNIPNVFNKITLSYTVPTNINALEIVLQNYESVSSYFKDLKINIIRKNKPYIIYSIDLFEEQTSQLYITTTPITTTYLDNSYFILEGNNIKEYINNTFNIINTPLNIVTDFCVSGTNFFTYTNNIVYLNDVFFTMTTSKNYIYTKNNTFYYNDTNNNIYVYDFNNKFIGKYPLDSKTIANNCLLLNNRILYNNIDIDPNNIYYGFNLKDIFGIYELDTNNIIIGVRNISDIIQLWKYTLSTKTFINFVDKDNNSDLISYTDDIKYIDLAIDNSYMYISLKNYINIYQIEKENKINYKKLVQKIDTSDNITNIRFENSNKITMITDDNKISFIYNSGILDLWEDTLTYNTITNGWIVGDSGVFFKDNSNSTSFKLDYINLVFKDDYTSIDVVKNLVKKDKGYVVKEWSNTAYIVGKSGKMISTNDGTNFNFIETGIFSDLNSVSFKNLTDGLIVGDNNTILSTFKGGNSFINLDFGVFRNWKDVLYYEDNKALVVGSDGTIIHITRNNFNWNIDSILNNTTIYELNLNVKNSDLEDSIKLILRKDNDTSIYRQTLNQIEYLGNNQFLIVGDNNLIVNIKLVFDVNFIVPYINFLKSDIDGNWSDVKIYDDKVINQKRAFIIGNKNVYSIQYDRINLLDTINTETTFSTLINVENKNPLTTISVYDNYLFVGGKKVENIRYELFNNNPDYFSDHENILNPWIHYNNGIVWNTVNGFNATLQNQKTETIYTEVDIVANTVYNVESVFSFTNNFIDKIRFDYFNDLSDITSQNYTFDSKNYTTNNVNSEGTFGYSAKYLGISAESTSGITNIFNIASISIKNKVLVSNQKYTYNSTVEKYDLTFNFKPRMLFMDYYLGRKINILLEDGNFITPTGNLDKSLLHCYYFNDNEFIEFTDYGTVDMQNNFLSYQDYYFLNRRELDMPNSWGKTQQPYQKYNKRLTSIGNYYENSTWSGELTPYGSNGDALGYQFVNEPVTDIQTFNIGQLKEDSLTTKIIIGYNNDDKSYTKTGSILNYSVNSNIGDKYTLKIPSYLNVNKNDLVVLSFSTTPYIVQTQFLSSGNIYIIVEGEEIPLINYTGTIQKAFLNIIENTNINDVLGLTVLSKNRNELLNIGDKLYLQLNTQHFNIFKKCTVIESTIPNNYQLSFVFDEFDQTVNINFGTDETIDDILLQLLDFNKSFAVSLINQLLSKRCLDEFTPEERIIEQKSYLFNTIKNLSDIVLIDDIMYVSSTNKLVFVIDSKLNSVIDIITTNSNAKYITYNPTYKLLYVSGGDNNNNFVDIIDITNNIIINSINLGVGSDKLLYSPYNNYVYVSTLSNKYFIINNQIIVNTLISNVKNHVYVTYNNYVYSIENSNLNYYLNDILLGTIVLSGTLNEIIFDDYDNCLYVSNETGFHIINLTTNVLDYVSVLQGIKSDSKTPFTFIDFNDNKLLFISNIDKYITIFNRITKTIVSTIYTNIITKGIVNNNSESRIYLAGDDGTILLMNYNNDIFNLQINQDVEDFKFNDCLGVEDLFYNNINNKVYALKTSTFSISDILSGTFVADTLDIELDKLVADTNVVIKDKQNNKLAFYEKLDDEFVYEANQIDKKVVVRNLNYFNGDLTNLKQIFDTHLLSVSYDLIINKENYIYINGVVNDYTKYYNLETNVRLGVYSGTNFNIINNEIKYDASVVYGANYNLLSFLKNLNPIFEYNYSFNLNSSYYTYNQQAFNNGYFEFSILKNKIYIGQDNTMNFLSGTFIDITNGNTINRVYIKDIVKEEYSNYNAFRYVITTDKLLETNLNLNGQVFIRTRDLLGEISLDLEFTDNINFPISNNGSHSVSLMNNTYYNNQVSSFQYAKILLNNDDIRNEISSILSLDEQGDFKLNVIDWKNDANFYYRPLELFEAGIDRVLKKSITIDSSNYRVAGNTLSLVNVDLTKYNYIITDGMTLKYVEENYYWILNADIRNAIIGQDNNGLVWYQGDWVAGTFESGTWYSGTAYDIEWIKGNVYSNTVINNYNIYSTINENSQTSTIWYNAIWYSGNFNVGTWNNGTFYSGNFLGIWNNGTWIDGVFSGLSFNGGNWMNGTWIKGNFSQSNTYSTWNNGLWFGGDFENGTWKNGVFNQTDSLKSRFGTKADLLNPAIWEYGWFKNGEFHSGLTLDANGNTIASSNYKYSYWYNGVWEKGSFYGGQTEMMTWKNGIFFNGYWKTNLNIIDFNIRNIKTNNNVYIEVVFDKPHYYKYLTVNDGGISKLLDNYFMMIGEPLITKGLINPNLELLGYNTKPIRHDIVEIINDTTVLISIEDSLNKFPYDIIAGTNGYLDINPFIPGTYSTIINSFPYFKEINSKKLVFEENGINVISNSSNKDYSIDFDNVITTFNLPIVGENLYHKKSNRTFIASNTKIKMIENNVISDINLGFLHHQFYIQNNNDTIVSLNKLNGSNVELCIINPYTLTYGIFELGYNVSDSYSGLNVNYVHIDKHVCSENNIYITAQYFDTFGLRTVLFKADNNGYISHSIIIGQANIIGINDNKILFFETDKITYAYTSDINTRIDLINDIYGSNIVTRYLKNTNQYFIMVNTTLYLWDTIVYETTSTINDIVYSEYYNAYHIASVATGIEVLSHTYEKIYTYPILNVKDMLVDEKNGDKIYVAANSHLYLLDKPICANMCTDYAVAEINITQSRGFDFSKFQYIGNPRIASHFVDGNFKQGIFEYGLRSNGSFEGGIWLDGVSENGLFTS